MSATVNDDTVTGAAAPYIEAVRVRIAGLPQERRAELLDDLTHHLAELAAEPDADLADHLGEPDDFAEEYLTSAGVDPSPRRSTDVMRTAVRDRMTGLANHPWVAAVLDFLPELRPAWWVVRAYVPVSAALAGYEMLPYPFPDRGDDGSMQRLLGTILALGAAAASVWLGRRATEGRHVRLNRAATAAGVIAGVVAMAGLNSIGVGGDVVYTGVSEGAYEPYPSPVYSAEGELITNFWLFDAQGNLLRDVYVYDQQGRPVSTPAGTDSEKATSIPVDETGSPIVNRYPQDELYVIGCMPAQDLVLAQPPTVLVPGQAESVTPTTPPPTAVPAPTPTTIVPPDGGLSPC